VNTAAVNTILRLYEDWQRNEYLVFQDRGVGPQEASAMAAEIQKRRKEVYDALWTLASPK
jgi:hypothetical protein